MRRTLLCKRVECSRKREGVESVWKEEEGVMYLSTISTTSTYYTSIDTRLTTPDFCATALAQKPPKRHKSHPP